MADELTRDEATSRADARGTDAAGRMDEPLPTADDPGGAHAKGYSADPLPGEAIPAEDPVPLAPAPDQQGVRVPERDNHVRPTGRSEPHGYGPNDRLMGSDR
jgi:hypothetical protein